MLKTPLTHTEEYYHITARNIFLSQVLQDIYKEFTEHGIALIPLKGIALIQNVYSDMGERYIGDIDILVKEKDIVLASKVLNELGYTALPSFENIDDVLRTRFKAIPFHSTSRMQCTIHLHWHLVNSTLPLFMYMISMADIWKSAKIELCNGEKIQMLLPEHLIIYLAIHAFKHSFNKRSLLYDLREAVFFYEEEIDWKNVLYVAKEWNATMPLYCFLYTASKLTDLNIPREVLCELDVLTRSKKEI